MSAKERFEHAARIVAANHIIRRPGIGLRSLYGHIPIIADASMPPNSFQLRSGNQCVRVRWPDPDAEFARWADDGGRTP